MFNDIQSLLLDCSKTHQSGFAYEQKMCHAIPHAPVVDRVKFIVDASRGKYVVNFGSASGGLHEAIKSVAKAAMGVDKKQPCDWELDLEDCPASLEVEAALEVEAGPDLLVCGEVLEHLSNPGQFLDFARRFNCPMIVTAPNAFSEWGIVRVRGSVENVNVDHVAWYSYHTLKTLIERHGFTVKEFFWYNGKPLVAEGLVMVAE